MWMTLPSKNEQIILAMFDASVTVQVSNGGQARFWLARWLAGFSLESSFPHLVVAVPKHIRKQMTVAQALQNDQWI
jgi:hypothetical protein